MIEYTFIFADGSERSFRVGEPPDRRTLALALPEWTRLEFHQCANCPLSPSESPRCPPALDLFRIAHAFGGLLSYERVRVHVRHDERTYETSCDVQSGLGSLLGLVMASSSCPILSQLQGLARMHLPFATFEETLFRTVGLYLVKQFFAGRDGRPPDYELEGLAAFYDELQTVNRHFKSRIEAASEKDANINAVNLLFSISALVSLSLESGLEQLREVVEGDLLGEPADAS